MYNKTLATTPPLGLKIENNTSLGFAGYFVNAYNASTGARIQGSCNLHDNIDTPLAQLRDVLLYCGLTFNSEAEVLTWFKAQTEVSFINAIRKYLVEVLLPKLKLFVNARISSGQPAPVQGTMTDVLQGWQAVFSRLDVVYNLDGTVKEFII